MDFVYTVVYSFADLRFEWRAVLGFADPSGEGVTEQSIIFVGNFFGYYAKVVIDIR